MVASLGLRQPLTLGHVCVALTLQGTDLSLVTPAGSDSKECWTKLPWSPWGEPWVLSGADGEHTLLCLSFLLYLNSHSLVILPISIQVIVSGTAL
jgi:hypothetical protein